MSPNISEPWDQASGLEKAKIPISFTTIPPSQALQQQPNGTNLRKGGLGLGNLSIAWHAWIQGKEVQALDRGLL